MRKHKLAACVGMRCRQQAAAFGADEGADQLALRKPHGRDPDGLVGCRGRGRATSPAEGWGERFGATQFRRVWLSQDFSNPPPLPPAPPRDTYLSLARLLAALSHRPCFLAGICVGLWASCFGRPCYADHASGRSAVRDMLRDMGWALCSFAGKIGLAK